MNDTTCDVLIVGAGPAGLSAARRLKRLGVERVVVIDREREAGGVPRHCFHTGFGIRDLRRLMSGPRYAAALTRRARRTGVIIRTECTATTWRTEGDARSVEITSPEGRQSIRARAILLATGCRERPRAARMVPGARPGGVYTTGALQQCVYLMSQKPGTRAIVVGAEHVSYSAVLTLAHAEVTTAAIVTGHAGTQTFAAAHWWVAGRRRIPLIANASVTRILGRDRVTGLEIETDGTRREIECDCIVFTGDWIPDHELCRAGDIPLDSRTHGPAVDASLRTLTPGVFAAGNVLRGAEPADVASLEGRHVADAIVRMLAGRSSWADSEAAGPIEVEAPIAWISPNRAARDAGNLPGGRFAFRVEEFLGPGRIVLDQNGRLLVERRFRKLIPNRWYALKGEPGVTAQHALRMRFEPG